MPDSILPKQTPFPIYSAHLRFKALSSGTNSFTITNVLQLLCMVPTSSTTAYPLIGAFRIKRIRLVDTSGSPIFLQWYGNQASGAVYQQELEVNAVGMPGAIPAVIDTRPPKNSAAAFWNGGQGNSVMFQVSASSVVGGTGGFLDLWFDWVPAQQTTSTTLNGPVTTSGIYTLPLGGPSASPGWPSVSPNAAQ